jgi:4-alpha-glucanotransferase
MPERGLVVKRKNGQPVDSLRIRGPVQDVLSLGSEARMNRPGTASGNWRWRLRSGQLDRALAERLAGLSALFDRS